MITLPLPSRKCGTTSIPTGDVEREPPALVEALYVRIVQRWTETLKDSFDWARWPLVGCGFSRGFMRGVRDARDREDIAWTCAMIACGIADEFDVLAVERRVGRLGRPLIRDDGAEGWRCTLTRDAGDGAHLDFWVLRRGLIEFEAFCPA
jgi:hypothetical protein